MYTAESTSFGFFVNKSNVCDLTLIYDIDDSVNNLYGFTLYEEFSIVNITKDELKQRWLNMNPDYTIAICNYYHNMRGSTGSILLNGFMAANRAQLAIIYMYTPRTATNVPPVNQQSTSSAPLFLFSVW